MPSPPETGKKSNVSPSHSLNGSRAQPKRQSQPTIRNRLQPSPLPRLLRFLIRESFDDWGGVRRFRPGDANRTAPPRDRTTLSPTCLESLVRIELLSQGGWLNPREGLLSCRPIPKLEGKSNISPSQSLNGSRAKPTRSHSQRYVIACSHRPCPACSGSFPACSGYCPTYSGYLIGCPYAVQRYRVISIGHRLLVPRTLRYSGSAEVHPDFGLRGIVILRREPPHRRH